MAHVRTRNAANRYLVAALKLAALGIFSIEASYITREHVFDITHVNGTSMNPTLSPAYHETGARDSIIWSMWRAAEKVKIGDVVLFRSPLDPEKLVAKRVIALGGDKVVLNPKRRPGYGLAPLPSEALVAANHFDSYGRVLQVPYGHMWVEGDNETCTVDSNTYGPVSRSLVIGRAWKAFLPWRIAFTAPWEQYHSKTRVIRGSEELPTVWLE